METGAQRQVGAILAIIAIAGGVALQASPGEAVSTLEVLIDSPVLFGVVLVGLYTVRPVLLWPISILSVVVGYGLGVGIGIPVGLVGAVCTTLPVYALARHAPRDEGMFANLHCRGKECIAIIGECRGVVAARLLPMQADVTSYAAGLSGVSPRSYVLGTFIGEIPWVVAGVVAGSSMRTLTHQGHVTGLPLVAGAIGVSVLVLAGPTLRHLREQNRLPESMSSQIR